MDKKYEDFFDSLYTQWYGKMLEYAFRLTSDRYLAEEIVQETFIQVTKQIDAIAAHKNAAGWLYLTTRNNALNSIKTQRRLKNTISTEEIEVPIEDEVKLDTLLYGCMNNDEADILVRFYQYKQSLKEISKAYNISETACKMRLIRAREKIKKKYKNIK